MTTTKYINPNALRRRNEADVTNIGILTFFFGPIAAGVIGIRQRSWRMFLIPAAVSICLELADNPTWSDKYKHDLGFGLGFNNPSLFVANLTLTSIAAVLMARKNKKSTSHG